MSFFPFALILIFFPKQMARGVVLCSKYLKREDISARQGKIALKIFCIGAIYLTLMAAQVLYIWWSR